MAIRNVVKVGEEILREHARPVTEFDARLSELLDDLAETMYASEGAGLAAPQVGVLRRVAVVDTGDGQGLVEFVNPVITRAKGAVTELEGCLSIPERHGYVERPYKVTVKAYDRRGNPFVVKAEGYRARAFCHEIDHLDGVLYIDKLTAKPESDA